MKQLRLLPAGAASWAVCAIGVAADPVALVAAAVVGVLVAVGLLVVAHRRVAGGYGTAAVAVLAAALAASSCAAGIHLRDAGLLTELTAEGAHVTVVGTVRSEARPVRSRFEDAPRFRVVVAVHTVTGRGRHGSATADVVVLGDERWQGIVPGTQVQTHGRLRPTDRADAAAAIMVASAPPTVTAPPGAVDRAVQATRDALLAVCDGLPDDARGLVPGVAIGDRSRLPDDLETAMRDAAVTHVTAVSGAHFSIIVLTVTGVSALLRLPRPARAAVVVVVMSAFVTVVGPQPSVLRAAVMGVVGVLGILLGRPSRAPAGLGVAVVVLLVHDPWLARSFGFALSVLATGAIALLAPPLTTAASRFLPRWLAASVAVPLAAQSVCAPVLVLFQPGVSGWAVPANLLAAPALVPATVLGVLGAATASWFPALAEVLVRGAALATWWIAAVSRTAASVPGARFDWPTGPVAAACLALLTTVALVLVLGRRLRSARLVVAAVLVLAVVVGPHVASAGRRVPVEWTVVACDVGQGDALVVRSGPSSAVVVDVGPDGPAAHRCLQDLGVTRIDLLVLTHFHADHVGGLAPVLAGRQVHAALVTPVLHPDDHARGALLALADAGVSVHVAGADPAPGVASTGDAGSVRWTVLSPAAERDIGPEPSSTQVNDASVVVLLETVDLTVLALGDAEVAAGDRVAGRIGPRLEVDVVKVAHHGSAVQSERLLATVRPVVALISAGRDNPHGHPAERTVDAYREAGATVLSTHECGAIAVRRMPGRSAALAVRADCGETD